MRFGKRSVHYLCFAVGDVEIVCRTLPSTTFEQIVFAKVVLGAQEIIINRASEMRKRNFHISEP